MKNDDPTRLGHMLEAAREAVELSQGETLESLREKRTLALALVKLIEVIGEAATNVSKERQVALSQIEWSKIIGMRNRLIHAYYLINFDVVWETVTRDLPYLITDLEVELSKPSADKT